MLQAINLHANATLADIQMELSCASSPLNGCGLRSQLPVYPRTPRSNMLSWKHRWSTYRRRTLWYLALVLLVILVPGELVRPVRLYLSLAVGAVVLAFMGVNTTWFWRFSCRAPVSRGFLWFDFGLCALGAMTATLGLAMEHMLVFQFGALIAMAGVDCALWAHESNRRFLLYRQESGESGC